MWQIKDLIVGSSAGSAYLLLRMLISSWSLLWLSPVSRLDRKSWKSERSRAPSCPMFTCNVIQDKLVWWSVFTVLLTSICGILENLLDSCAPLLFCSPRK